ncbi:MAG: 5-oxoprolinase (ATP-hydrolyzing) subunit, partial [Ilumatobacteraceae bacterium]
MPNAVDLNSDVGEGFGAWAGGPDRELMSIITSANIACGFHAGDPTIIRRTCEMAVENGVAIGAHVSYPDLAGFGRRFIDMKPDELADAVVYQHGAHAVFARAAGSAITYVNPHGAQYNKIEPNEPQ